MIEVEIKEAEVAQDNFIRMLKLEQDQKILELRQEFDRIVAVLSGLKQGL